MPPHRHRAWLLLAACSAGLGAVLGCTGGPAAPPAPPGSKSSGVQQRPGQQSGLRNKMAKRRYLPRDY